MFWAWNGNEEGKDQWEAPEPKSMWAWLPVKSDGPKTYYGNNRALYKMYFTARMADAEEDIPQNLAVDFAKLMIPEVNKALFPERYHGTESEAPAPAATSAESSAAKPDAGAAEAAPAGEPAASK